MLSQKDWDSEGEACVYRPLRNQSALQASFRKRPPLISSKAISHHNLNPESESRMTVFKPRSRMISVRLSEDEYCALQRLCSATGARSVSDLTRDAMQSLVDGSSQESLFGNCLDEFRAQITDLDRKIMNLADLLMSSKVEKEG